MRRKQASDLQAIADRVEIEALRGEFTDDQTNPSDHPPEQTRRST
jgi:hypothetical protein